MYKKCCVTKIGMPTKFLPFVVSQYSVLNCVSMKEKHFIGLLQSEMFPW